MIEYIYIVKCPNCEDEHFHFFDDAKTCAMGYISDKPIITQVEVERNDFGECTDSHDLGTVWSWEDMMKDVPEDTDCSVFTKGDLNNFTEYDPDSDPEFDNTIDFLNDKSGNPTLEEARVDSIDSVEATDRMLISLVQDKIKGPLADRVGSSDFYSENGQRFMVIPVSINSDTYDFDSYKQELKHVFPTTDIYPVMDDYEIVIDVTSFYKDIRKPVPEDMSIKDLVEAMEENEDEVECVLCNELFPKADCHYDEGEGYICTQCKEGPLDETYERDPLDHHDPDYNEDEAANYIADQNDRAKDVNFDIELSSLQESFNSREPVEFEYDDLEITVTCGDMDPETGTYDTCERTVSYTYEQDKGDVAVDIWENFITEEDVVDVPGGLEALEDETLWNKFLETHFDTLFDKYYKNLLELYRKYATSSCQDNYNSGCINFDDFYSEDIDKNTIGHSMLEELEESEDYRNRLTLCPECGTNSFGPETCICMNCGFNTLK